MQVSFVASAEVSLADGRQVLVMVDQLSRLVQTRVGVGGSLPQFNPFEGTSSFPQASAVQTDCKASTCLQPEVQVVQQ